MSVINIKSRLDNIQRYRFNPSALQRDNILIVRQAINGDADIVDPTNPVVMTLEAAAVSVAGFMVENEALNRKQYAIAAVTEDDLYMHMSDKDYINRFAVPSEITITLLIRKDELINAMVPDGTNGMKKLTLPRNTVFTVADTPFSLQYPVDIRMQAHGGLDAVYDATKVSPLLTLNTNRVEMEERMDPSKISFMELKLPVHQFNITTKYNDVTAASGFSMRMDISQQFYHARVWLQNTDSSWQEIQTTHTDQVYDINVPTAVLKVYDTSLLIRIPTIYTTTGAVRGKLRVDLYQTRGDIQLLLKNYSVNDFTANFLAIDSRDLTPAVAAIKTLRTFVMYSESQATGGRAALTFDQLQKRVIDHSVGPQSLPITNVELTTSLQDNGYEIVRNVDTITNRVLQAIKAMPKPQDDRLITPAAASINTAILRFAEFGLAQGVLSHIYGATLTPDALYQMDNGVTTLVTNEDYQNLRSLNNAQKVEAFTNKRYLYSPFHYVLDNTKDSFVSRAYYLDGPKILSKNFIAENATTGFQVSLDSTYTIERITQGYRLTVSTRSNQAYRALADDSCFAQLSFRAEDQSVSAFMLGTQLPRNATTDERVYVFDMHTNFAIDDSHSIDQTSFLFSPTNLTTRCALEQDFQIFFATDASMPLGINGSIVDQQLGYFQLPLATVGLSWEKMRIRLGLSLDTLWTRTRTVVNTQSFKTYTEDIPAYYTADVYDVDENGAFFDVQEDGTLVYRINHHEGDPVLTPDGEQMYRQRIGDVVKDIYGKPIPIEEGNDGLIHHTDIFLIEGAYRFATDSVSRDYRNLLTDSVVSWISEDLSSIQENLLDETRIYYYPKVTQGNVRAIALNGQEVLLEAGQALTVKLHLPTETFDNIALLNNLKKSTLRILDTSLKQVTVAISEITSSLRNQYGNDVIDVEINGLGGSNNYSTLTMVDQEARLSLRKRLVAQPDGQLIVEEDVTFIDIRHSSSIL